MVMACFKDFTKICRVCMSDGSRDIFCRIAPSPIPSTSSGSTSPLDRLLEKLRYITMMKIEENDDLPRLICDLCIVQLNVAYNFKRLAVENDTKLRQYFIENGISSNNSGLSTSTNISNENQNPKNTLTVSNISSLSDNSHSTPLVPFIIKTEPVDNDVLSDVPTEISLNTNRFGLSPSTIQSVNTSNNREIRNTIDNSAEIFDKNKNNFSVVFVNGYGYNSLTPSSDIESVHNQTPSSRQQQSLNESTSTVNEKQSHQNKSLNRKNNCRKKLLERTNSGLSSSTVATTSTVLQSKDKTKMMENDSKNLNKKLYRSSELRNLLIDMNVPIGKRIHTIDSIKDDGKIKLRSQKSNSGLRKVNMKKQNNPNKLCNKPTRGQKEFLVNLGQINNNGLSKSSNTVIGNKSPRHKLFINPYCNNTEQQQNKQKKVQTRTKKKVFYNEGRIKEKTVTKLLTPKLEPIDK